MSALAAELSLEASTRRGLPRPFVLVTGGKGGVGKSTVAANLAGLLGRVGAHPLLLDLDFQLANLDILLGVRPTNRIGAHLFDAVPLRDCLLAAQSGITLLPAGSGRSEEPSPVSAESRERLVNSLRALSKEFGIVVGDSAAGVGPEVLSFAFEADRVLIVTTPEPAALTDAYALVKALDHRSRTKALELPTPELFVNLAESAEHARSSTSGLIKACRKFLGRSPRLIGWMPRGRAVLKASLARRLFVLDAPKAPATSRLAHLAQHWLDSLLAAAPAKAPSAMEKGSQA